MSRRHPDRLTYVLALALVIIGAIAFTLLATRVDAAKAPDPSCWWEGTVLHAVDLPDRPFSVTLDPYPTGVAWTTEDGTFSIDIGWEAPTAYFWTRGGGGSLFKAGRQLNDYHVICIAERSVT